MGQNPQPEWAVAIGRTDESGGPRTRPGGIPKLTLQAVGKVSTADRFQWWGRGSACMCACACVCGCGYAPAFVYHSN